MQTLKRIERKSLHASGKEKGLPFGRSFSLLPPFGQFIMKSLKFAVLPGDGIGPEVMEVTLEILGKVLADEGYSIDATHAPVGGAAIDQAGEALPESTVKVCEESDAILFGSVGGPKWESLPPAQQPERASLLPLRKHFQLFANVRPGLLYPELVAASPLKTERIPDGIDMVCIRELTGGIYFGQPKERRDLDDGDVEALDTMIYKKSEIERIAEVAAQTALARDKRVCSVDKANVLTTSVLWREVVTAFFAEKYPEIELSHMYVDNAAMQLARDPNQFDVLLTENMFGDILSDEMGIVCGSLGMLCSASLGLGTNSLGNPFGLYEPAGGTAPDIAGLGVANPCAQILSGAMMLRFSFGLNDIANRIEKAIKETVQAGTRTGDIAFGLESVNTRTMADAILSRL
jgi:3-isopropylmalate dehydrogenase